jgi:hypothetical protein
MEISKQTTRQEKRYRELKIIIEVNKQAEDFYPESTKLGKYAAEVFKDGKQGHRSQLTNLETIANSAFKVSDVLDYVKRQTARQEKTWSKPNAGFGQGSFGTQLQKALENLDARRNTICNHLGIGESTDEDCHLRRHIHLLLIRHFIQQLVVQYEYTTSQNEQQSAKQEKA